MTHSGKIIFPDGPWPDGEPLAVCRISSELGAGGMCLGIHIESIEHTSQDSPYDCDDDSLPDFKHPYAWENYGKIILSNTHWRSENRQKTIKLPTPFRFSDLDNLKLKLDFPPQKKGLFKKRKLSEVGDFPDVDQFYFGIYALGHGHVAHHRIQMKIMSDDQINLHWTGLMADSYFGNDTFAYPFTVEARVPFHGLRLEPKTLKEDADRLLDKAVGDPGEWQLKCNTPDHVNVVRNDARFVRRESQEQKEKK